MTADLLWGGDGLVPDAAYTAAPYPKQWCAECRAEIPDMEPIARHRASHRDADDPRDATPPVTLQDEARWRAADYAAALAEQARRRVAL